MKKVFVAYPYSLSGYRDFVASAGEGIVELIYADEVITSKHILEKITDLMKESDLSLFDLTGPNANVALELGVAIGLNLNYRVLLNASSDKDVFSDMRGWDQLRYTTFDELKDKLSALFHHADTFRRPNARLSEQELAVQPYLHIDLHGGMSGPSGCFLEGFVRNVGEGIAREPMLRLPGLGDTRLAGLMKPGETVPLKFRYDDKPCYTNRLDDSMASAEFEDRLGNLYRQEGPITQSTTPSGSILTYSINALGVPYKVPSREISPSGPTPLSEGTTSEQVMARARPRTTTNQRITRIGFGQHANALTETHFGAGSFPLQQTSNLDIFDSKDDETLEGMIRSLPSCGKFRVLPVTEGLIASDSPFDAQSFGGLVNAIHVKTGGGIVVRFGVRGDHQFYDFFRTLGSVYALAKYMHRNYETYPESEVGFGFTIIGEQNPNTLPTPTYEGAFEMDVSRDTFADAATDAVLACLRAGTNPREKRSEVADSLESFWRNQFGTFVSNFLQ